MRPEQRSTRVSTGHIRRTDNRLFGTCLCPFPESECIRAASHRQPSKARRLRRAYTIGETICVLSGSCWLCLQSRLAYARHSAACSLEIIGKQKAADGADITVRVQDRRQMPARNIENLRMVHQSDEILLHFRREEILIGQDEKNFSRKRAKPPLLRVSGS